MKAQILWLRVFVEGVVIVDVFEIRRGRAGLSTFPSTFVSIRTAKINLEVR